MKRIICFIKSHKWTEWQLIHGYFTNPEYKLQESRTCTRCFATESRDYRGKASNEPTQTPSQ